MTQQRVLTAGTSRVVITPPVGIAMSGFAGRPPSVGVHDDLTATALVLCERSAPAASEGDAPDASADASNGDALETRVALVALDLIGLRADTLVAPMKARIRAATGIAPERIFLNCS